MIIPPKLKMGDEVRIVAPSKSLALIDQQVVHLAEKRMSDFGIHISYSQNALEKDHFISSSIHQRIDDLHSAFSDPKVKAIFSAIGGYNCNQLLPYLDYKLIQQNPKIFCGYSDITVLANALWAKTSLVNYSGPQFSTFGCQLGIDYMIEYFKKALFFDLPFTLSPSTYWSDDKWYRDQQKRDFIVNSGPQTLQSGQSQGTLIGGNLSSFCLLLGTHYCPSFEDTILFLEDDSESHAEVFDRQLQSILQQKSFSSIKGLVIGRFQKHNHIPLDILKKIVESKKELKGIPIVADVDFGHTLPLITFPIGGIVQIEAEQSLPPQMTFLHH